MPQTVQQFLTTPAPTTIPLHEAVPAAVPYPQHMVAGAPPPARPTVMGAVYSWAQAPLMSWKTLFNKPRGMTTSV